MLLFQLKGLYDGIALSSLGEADSGVFAPGDLVGRPSSKATSPLLVVLLGGEHQKVSPFLRTAASVHAHCGALL